MLTAHQDAETIRSRTTLAERTSSLKAENKQLMTNRTSRNLNTHQNNKKKTTKWPTINKYDSDLTSKPNINLHQDIELPVASTMYSLTTDRYKSGPRTRPPTLTKLACRRTNEAYTPTRHPRHEGTRRWWRNRSAPWCACRPGRGSVRRAW